MQKVKNLIKGKRLVDGSLHLEHPLSVTRPAFTQMDLCSFDHMRTSRRGRFSVTRNYYVKSGGTYQGWK